MLQVGACYITLQYIFFLTWITTCMSYKWTEKLFGSVSASERIMDLLWSWMTGIPFSEMPGLKGTSGFTRSSVSSCGWLIGCSGCPFSMSWSWTGWWVFLVAQNVHLCNWIKNPDMLKKKMTVNENHLMNHFRAMKSKKEITLYLLHKGYRSCFACFYWNKNFSLNHTHSKI